MRDDILQDRLIVADEERGTFETFSKQNYYRVLELLENAGRRFFTVERPGRDQEGRH